MLCNISAKDVLQGSNSSGMSPLPLLESLFSGRMSDSALLFSARRLFLICSDIALLDTDVLSAKSVVII